MIHASPDDAATRGHSMICRLPQPSSMSFAPPLPPPLPARFGRVCSLARGFLAERNSGKNPLHRSVVYAFAGVTEVKPLSTGVSCPDAPFRQNHHLVKKGSSLTHSAVLRATQR